MTALTWDSVGERLYETGVDHGVLYRPDESGDYGSGVAWNGLVTVTEKPTGADSNPLYADNIKYLNLIAAEQFGATIEAYTYPDEFAECDGTATPHAGVVVGQQNRKIFGLCFRTQVGNDIDGTDHGHKLHLIYGCQASPSEKAYGSINDKPEAIAFSWDVSTTPIGVSGLKPTAQLVIDSTKVDAAELATLETTLYGSGGVAARLPLPDEVIGIFSGGTTVVRLVGATAPSYDAATHVVTLPAVAGVQWKINDVNKPAGAQPALIAGQTSLVTAEPTAGHELAGDDDWTFDF